MCSHGAVMEIVQAQRDKQDALKAQKAHEEALAAEARKKEKAARDAEERRRKAWEDLQGALGTGRDEIASVNAGKVSMDLLAQRRNDGYNALHCAASQGLIDCCEVIMKRKDFLPEMLIAQDLRGWTPLHCAVTSTDNGSEICSLIAGHAACQVGIKDNEGRTAVVLAMEWGLGAAKTAILDAIGHRVAKARAKKLAAAEAAADLEAGMIKNQQSDQAEMEPGAAFRYLQEGRIQDCIALIKSVWPFINQKDDTQSRCRTLLHHAAYYGEPDICEAILDRHDWRLTDEFDLDRATALHLAAANRHVECCIAIVSSGRCLQPNLQDMRDQTALHLAAVRGDSECYNAIWAHELIDLGVRDYKQKLAPEYAIERELEIKMPVIPRVDERDLPIDDPDLEVDL